MKTVGHGILRNSNRIAGQRRLRQRLSHVDRMSHLPTDVILHIFNFLPLKYWILMSVVCKRFKYLWTCVPKLDLDEKLMVVNPMRDDTSCPKCGGNPQDDINLECYLHCLQAARNGFVGFVDRIIRFHSGLTIKSFRLSINYYDQTWDVSKVHSWVDFSLTRNIKMLELHFGERAPYNYCIANGLSVTRMIISSLYALPSKAFAPKILTTLTLSSCQFSASNLGTFESLGWLYLVDVDLTDHTIGQLLSKFPVLRSLFMKHCVIEENFFVCEQDITIKALNIINCLTSNWVMFPVDITAPAMLFFRFVGTYLKGSSIRRANMLGEAEIEIKCNVADNSQGNFMSSLLDGLKNCQFLTLKSWCIQVLPTRQFGPWECLLQFRNMVQLNLDVQMIKQELPGISLLLRSCPNLQILLVDIPMTAALANVTWEGFNPDVFNFQGESYWDSHDMSFHCLRKSLKNVKISGFTGKRLEFKFVKFILQNAMVLETMHIFNRRLYNPLDIEERTRYSVYMLYIKNMVRFFGKASPHALVKIS